MLGCCNKGTRSFTNLNEEDGSNRTILQYFSTTTMCFPKLRELIPSYPNQLYMSWFQLAMGAVYPRLECLIISYRVRQRIVLEPIGDWRILYLLITR